jgi:hypothetical protein
MSPALLDPPTRPGAQPPLWLSWGGLPAGAVRQPGAVDDVGGGVRIHLPPSIWTPLPDGSGVFNRTFITIPPQVMAKPRPVLSGYMLWDQQVGGTNLWLPLVAAELFEQSLPWLPPAALQIRPLGPMEQPNWRVVTAGRNPFRAWDRRQTIYSVPNKPSKPLCNVYFAADGRPVSVEVLELDPVAMATGGPDGLQMPSQGTLLWIGLA